MATTSIIIPTLGRNESYYTCKESIYDQSNQDYEIIKVTREGPLAEIRNEGARRAKGKYLVFIDDDVICEPGWLDGILSGFERGADGVSGPSYTTNKFRSARDVFRFEFLHNLLSSGNPGHFSQFGAASLAATKEDCDYQGEVEYLEACNMAFSAETFWSVGGFDERYKGIGDWSEPDLCFRIRKNGGHLWFSRNARLEHRPSRTGAYKKRLVKCDRMENYELFSSRWIKPSWRHSAYKRLLRAYFVMKENRLV